MRTTGYSHPPPLNFLPPHPTPQETQRLQADPIEGIMCSPYADNSRYFRVEISGSSGTAYEGKWWCTLPSGGFGGGGGVPGFQTTASGRRCCCTSYG